MQCLVHTGNQKAGLDKEFYYCLVFSLEKDYWFYKDNAAWLLQDDGY